MRGLLLGGEGNLFSDPPLECTELKEESVELKDACNEIELLKGACDEKLEEAGTPTGKGLVKLHS